MSINEPHADHTTEDTGPTPPGTTSINEPDTAAPEVPAEPPLITALSPESALLGSADAVVSVTGSGFIATSVVVFDAVDAETDYISDTELSFLAPISALASAGAVDVIVSNDGIDSVPFPFDVTSA